MDKASETLGKIQSETYASDIYKDLVALQAPQDQNCAEGSQLSAVLDFIRENYRKNLTITDATRLFIFHLIISAKFSKRKLALHLRKH